MDEKEKREFYRDQLFIIVICMILFCVVMCLLYFILITPHITFEVLNNCTKEIVGNCIVKFGGY